MKKITCSTRTIIYQIIHQIDQILLQVDISKTPFINTIWVHRPISEIIVKITAVLPVIIFGITGNFFVLYVLLRNPHIRTPINLLIGNMAAADFISILINPWLFLISDFLQNYPFGRIGCQGEGAIECEYKMRIMYIAVNCGNI